MPHHAVLPLWDDKSPPQKLEALRHMILDLYAYTLATANDRLLALLDSAQPADSAEADSIARMHTLIRQHPNILAQNCEVGHVVASGLIIDLTAGRLLLLFHKKLELWLPTGGHLEAETDVAPSALREAIEESGLPDLRFYPDAQNPVPLDFDLHAIPASHGRPPHLHLDFRYLFATTQPDAVHINPDESLGVRWLGFDEVYAAADIAPDIKRMARKAERIYQANGGR